MRRMRRLLLVLCLVSCQAGTITRIEGDLEVSPSALDFGEVWLGASSERTLTLQNRSRASRSVSLAISSPFSVPATELRVPGGAHLDVPVTFTPLTEGQAAASLVIDGAVEVPLSGAARAVPGCPAPATCRTSVFDTALGACVERPVSDGTACASACLVNGACSAGQCLGTALSCDDGDACSVDACDAAGGCVHVPVVCPAPSDPCKVARCDKASGCAVDDAPDGTACGPADCVSARVCLLGECRTLSVPEGSKCGEASPCQGAGTCQQSACVRPPPQPLAEAWRYDTSGGEVLFEGLSDSAQNLYFIECVSSACAAVSLTRDGALRFRTPVAGAGRFAQLLVGDVLVYAGASTLYAVGNEVSALSLADGSPRWTVPLPLQPPGVFDPASSLGVTGLAADSSGVLLALARGNGVAFSQHVLWKLDAATGATVYTRPQPGYLGVPVVDAADNVYFGVTAPAPPRTRTLVSLSTAGVERWRTTAPEPVATFDGELLLDNGELRFTADGGPKTGPLAEQQASNPLMTVEGRVFLVQASAPLRIDAVGLGPGTATERWRSPVTAVHGYGPTGSVATAGGGFLIGMSSSRHPSQLAGFSAQGVERFACELGGTPSPAYLPGAVALLDGRWVALVGDSLRAYEVPLERPAARGWVSAGGSATGGRRPLP